MTIEFGQRLSALLSERNRNASWLARKVPTDAAHISRLRSGIREPSRVMALRIADALDIHGEERTIFMWMAGKYSSNED